jgi:arginine deiminase
MATQPTTRAPFPSGRPRLGVGSDVDRLTTVLVHRPGCELHAIREADPGEALFASVPHADGVRRDHDRLTQVLRDHDVEVLYLESLLYDVDDVPALSALPNLMYVRDSSFWVGDHALPGTMREPARRAESRLLEAVYRRHARFAGATVQPPLAAPVEGGDVLCAGDGRVLVGISERTGTAGATRLARRLLGEAGVREVVTVLMPAGAGFHLDLALTLVDRDTFAIWSPVRDRLRAHRWRATSGEGVAASAVDDPLAGARVLRLDGSDAHRHGREWDHGVNVLAIAPGVVIAYADNVHANDRLRAAGVDVLEVPAEHLGAGRGGPRCLTCPVARAPAGR